MFGRPLMRAQRPIATPSTGTQRRSPNHRRGYSGQRLKGTRRSTSGLFLLVCLLSLLVVWLNPTALSGDPAIYLSRLAAFLAGDLPYLEAQFEHLPLALVPMVLAWALGGWIGPGFYTGIFAVLMAACLWATALLMDRIGEQLSSPRADLRWLLIAGPLFPLVLFRFDPWPVLLAAAALTALLAGRERATLGWLSMGVLAKGWPLAIAVVVWLRGRWAKALVLVSLSLAFFAALWLLPEFRSGREFTGIHTDSMIGSVLALVRAVAGDPVGRFDAAGAIYLEAPPWALLINADIGLILMAIALIRVRMPLTDSESVSLSAALVVALLVGSPLLSPQFILWPTAFLALHPSRTIRYLGCAVAATTLIFMLGWNPVYEGMLWWLPLVTLRNLLLLALGVLISWNIGATDDGERQ